MQLMDAPKLLKSKVLAVTRLLDEQVFKLFLCLFFLIKFCIVEVLKIFEVEPIIEKL